MTSSCEKLIFSPPLVAWVVDVVQVTSDCLNGLFRGYILADYKTAYGSFSMFDTSYFRGSRESLLKFWTFFLMTPFRSSTTPLVCVPPPNVSLNDWMRSILRAFLSSFRLAMLLASTLISHIGCLSHWSKLTSSTLNCKWLLFLRELTIRSLAEEGCCWETLLRSTALNN